MRFELEFSEVGQGQAPVERHDWASLLEKVRQLRTVYRPIYGIRCRPEGATAWLDLPVEDQ